MIAFASNRAGTFEIFVMKADGSGVSRISLPGERIADSQGFLMLGWFPVVVVDRTGVNLVRRLPQHTGARSERASVVRWRRAAPAALVWGFLAANAGMVVALWVHGGNLHVHTTGEGFTSIARITGLLCAYLALVQVVLLARLPWLEKVTGFDRLSVWHRWNGHAVLWLLLGHVVFSVWGYALMDKFTIPKEISTMIGGGVYPGMITATIGTALLIAVVVSSVVIVRRRLRYETWYLVHLTAYAGIALGWFHQIPTGNELILHPVVDWYWKSLYLATLAVLIVFRVAAPVRNAVRLRLRVADIVHEGAGVVSLRITGCGLERLQAAPGQFFLWRFLDRRRAWLAHPFSLSAAPTGESMRITVKALGDHTGRMGEVALGTRVVAEGPFGTFTDAARRRDKVLLVAGGIGITPVRALLEAMGGDIVVLYRVVAEEDIVFAEELDGLTRASGAVLHYVVGDHATPEGAALLTPEHLRELVPDLAERDVFLCGPPGMTKWVEDALRRAGVRRRHLHIERFAL
jgi:predicted ferric reductase